MKIFGGDPRSIHLEILFQINVWYDVLVLPLLVMHQILKLDRMEGLLILIPFIFFEVIRINLNVAHRTGDIPLYVGFLMLTVIPLFVLDLIWIAVSPSRTGLDIIIMIGYLVQYLIQLSFCTTIYRAFKAYQVGFYQFARGVERQGNDLDVEIADDDQ
jgi:hypothetical protein